MGTVLDRDIAMIRQVTGQLLTAFLLVMHNIFQIISLQADKDFNGKLDYSKFQELWAIVRGEVEVSHVPYSVHILQGGGWSLLSWI